MKAKTFDLTISTPFREFFHAPCEQITLSSIDGEIGVLPGHIDMVIALMPAPVRFREAGGRERLAAVSDGFALIDQASVTILSDTAEWPEEIELNRALEAKQRAEETLRAHKGGLEYMHSQIALRRALMRLHVKNQLKR